MIAADYLKKAYARRLIPDEGGGFVASIQEFPGLVAHGEDPATALSRLDAAAESWIEAALETGQPIPEPIDYFGYSGKIALRIPRGLHKRSAEMASSEGSSLNGWLTTAIAHYLGGREATSIAIDAVFKSYNYSITNNNFITKNIEQTAGVYTGGSLYGITSGTSLAGVAAASPYLSGSLFGPSGLIPRYTPGDE